MSIVFKAVAGLVAGVVAGGLGLAFLPRVDPNALKPRSAVEKPQFVVASVPSHTTPQPAATLAVATETPTASPSPAAPAAPVEKGANGPASASLPSVGSSKSDAALKADGQAPKPAIVAPSPAAAATKSAGVAVAETSAAGNPQPVVLQTEAPHLSKPATEDAARWSARGLVALAKGDLSNARLFLTRAAEAGDARALVALADTYDPAMLAKLGVVFAPGDPARAHDFLVKAIAAGVVVPKERLATLESGEQQVR